MAESTDKPQCKHPRSVEVTAFEDERKVRICSECGDQFDGGPKR